MFTAILFVITQDCKQPKRLSAVEWINKLWYLQITEYYSAKKKKKNKKNELLAYTTTRVNLKKITLSKMNHIRKKYIFYISMSMKLENRQN